MLSVRVKKCASLNFCIENSLSLLFSPLIVHRHFFMLDVAVMLNLFQHLIIWIRIEIPSQAWNDKRCFISHRYKTLFFKFRCGEGSNLSILKIKSINMYDKMLIPIDSLSAQWIYFTSKASLRWGTKKQSNDYLIKNNITHNSISTMILLYTQSVITKPIKI